MQHDLERDTWSAQHQDQGGCLWDRVGGVQRLSSAGWQVCVWGGQSQENAFHVGVRTALTRQQIRRASPSPAWGPGLPARVEHTRHMPVFAFQLPLSLLKTAQNHPMLVELKNGETYNGHLVSCDNWMNINLREVICTSRVSALCPRVCAHHLEALRWGWSGRQRAWGQCGQGCTWTRGLLSLSILAHKWGEGLSLALVGGIDGVPPSDQHSWPARGGACGRCGAPCALDFAPVRALPRWVLSWPAGLSCCVSVGRPPGYKSLLWAHPFLLPASSAFSPGCGQAIVVWPWAVQATRGRGQPSGPGLLFTS
uniref:LSM4 homolog, U6 small nuclear RNA and mRNA degradation associated n=1 Tax=Equus caballus TaxID=9796 RepID=A0A9L0TJJ8_HORSE